MLFSRSADDYFGNVLNKSGQRVESRYKILMNSSCVTAVDLTAVTITTLFPLATVSCYNDAEAVEAAVTTRVNHSR